MLDLKKLRRSVEEALKKETTESLNLWLDSIKEREELAAMQVTNYDKRFDKISEDFLLNGYEVIESEECLVPWTDVENSLLSSIEDVLYCGRPDEIFWDIDPPPDLENNCVIAKKKTPMYKESFFWL